MSSLFAEVVQDQFDDVIYYATAASLSCQINNTVTGLQLSLAGYDEKLPQLLFTVLELIVKFDVSEQRFSKLKEKKKRKYSNFLQQNPYMFVTYLTELALEHPKWSMFEYLQVIDEVTLPAFKEHVRRLFVRLHYEMMVVGNFTREEASNLSLKVDELLKPRAPFPAQLLTKRVVQLEDKSNYVYSIKSLNQDETNHAIQVYYQVGFFGDTRKSVLLQLFSRLTSNHCYDTLRTKQQLGYVVFSGVNNEANVVGFRGWSFSQFYSI